MDETGDPRFSEVCFKELARATVVWKIGGQLDKSAVNLRYEFFNNIAYKPGELSVHSRRARVVPILYFMLHK